MSNLYDVLEVSEKASKEVIDKAYRVLTKKYHPDLQESEQEKKIAQEKMQKINEAYEVLSDDEKRKIYDLKLEQEKEEQKRIEDLKKLEELEQYKREGQQENNFYEEKKQNKVNYNQEENSSYENIQKINNEITRAYKQAYYDYWRSKGYKIKEPWTWKRFLKLLETLGIILGVILILWIFPPTHNLLMHFYESNIVFKTIVDIIGTIFIGIKNGFTSLFSEKLIV